MVRRVRVFGPVMDGPIVGSRHRLGERQHSVAVLGGGAAAVGVPGSLPARASSAGAAAAAGSPSGSPSGGHGAANPARSSLELAPLGPVPLRDWLSHASTSGGGGLWCLFDASQASLGGSDASPASALGALQSTVGCEAPLAPAGFAAARIVADGGAEVLSAAEIEFRPSPAVLRAHGSGPGEPGVTAGEGAAVDISGSGFFDGLRCAWNGVV